MVHKDLTVLLSVLGIVSCSALVAYDLRGKIALVTGGSRGIGYSIVYELLSNGVQGITIVNTNAEQGRNTTRALNNRFGNGKVIFIRADVSSLEQFEDVFKIAIGHWKGLPLDIVINNAGTASEENWKNVINVNAVGTVQGTLFGLKYMSQRNGGRGGIIINISSIYGIDDMMFLPVYSASKHFITTLTRSFGNQIYNNYNSVRIITFCPGLTETGLSSKSAITNGIAISLKPDINAIFEAGYDQSYFQPTSSVGKAFITVLKKGEHGSVWVIEDDKLLYEVEFRNRKSMRKEDTKLIQ